MSFNIKITANILPKIAIFLGFLLILAVFLPLVNSVSSQNSMKITFEPEDWTDDMKRVKMTTYERGLRIRIDITNLDEEDYLDIEYLRIRIERRYEEEDYNRFEYVEWENIAVPPSNTTSTFEDIDLHYITGSLGKWSLRLGYVTAKGSTAYDVNKIEPYPFEFKVASEEELQKAIEENPSAPIINIYIPITITAIGLPSLTIIIWHYWSKKKRRR